MQLSYPPALPISEHSQEICTALQEHQVIIVAGDTGSGKTTQLPKMCLQAGLGKEARIGCTQPRRIAAISVAERVEEELKEPGLAGYKIRFQDRISEQTVIKFMTDGVLLAETKSDRLLRQYDTLIIDEAHERSLNIDFLLGYLKQLLPRRPDLKLIISSATIDTDKFSQHFSQAPVITVSGRLFPIETRHLGDEERDEGQERSYVDQAVEVLEDLCADPFGGDILVFMPTERDIFDTLEGLSEPIRRDNLLLPLFGRLQASDQRKIFQASKKRKIIVATNVAETSITVPGIRYVVDSGLARISRYNIRTGTTSLRISKVSQASCNQRQGRCGRTGPGVCIRLYSEEDYLARDEFTLPEIQRSNLAEVILQMVSLKLGQPEQFPFVDAPLPRAIREGYRTLRETGALTGEHSLTANGRLMATLPLDPRISRIIIESAARGALRESVILAAALSVQDPRVRPLDREQQAREAHARFKDQRSDFLSLLNIWDQLFAEGSRVSWSRLSKFCKTNFLAWQRMREWIDVHEQILGLLKRRSEFTLNREPAAYDPLHISLTSGFLRNFCRKKERNIYLAPGNKEVILFPGSALHKRGGEWIVAAHFVETTQLFARTAANIKVEWLEELGGDLCKRSWSNPRWEKKSGQVIADEQVSLFGIPIVHGRRVNYGRLNRDTRQEAKELFIREALIPDKLGGRYPFLAFNQNLIREYREIEERLRRRTIVADEEQLFHFYDERLVQVYDRFTLNRLLRRKKNDAFLRMSQADICLDAPADDELYRFPPTLQVGEFQLQLRYRFEPGKEQDGVSACIPRQIASHLNPNIFEWLVPGLLPEKLLYLLKRLPKRIRKNLVPLPDTVDRIMDGLELYKGSLYQGIEQALLRSHRLQIQRADWLAEALPAHLTMHFVLLDEEGKEVCFARSFNQILQQAKGSAPSQRKRTVQSLPTLDNISAEELDLIDPTISFPGKGGGVELYYPALQVDPAAKQVHLRYLQDEEQSLQANRHALEALYARNFAQESTQLKKQCKAAVTANSASWLSLGGNYSAAALKEALYSFVMAALFAIEGNPLPSYASFCAHNDAIRKQGLLRAAAPLMTLLADNLQKRKEARQKISSWAQRARKLKNFDSQRHHEYNQALERILPQNFLISGDPTMLQNGPRYLQALIIRIERAEHAPEKDRRKAERLIKANNRLDQARQFSTGSGQCRQSLNHYRQLLEEFRVSVFAPELGTTTSVSEKKLEQFWSEVENTCRRVE
ncbi:ATP-dependent RNA helicase HrpA [Desulfogranum mediterraneum]|uniref:ATP-dependent RNA helicase HrpA n=1 Tax=Desulfogranum mediterraneum TaxID=160661 RepID=UPI00040DD277|nr:ATP-dependent RNA helicase HrpA [Desulfogranum mediterraneum]